MTSVWIGKSFLERAGKQKRQDKCSRGRKISWTLSPQPQIHSSSWFALGTTILGSKIIFYVSVTWVGMVVYLNHCWDPREFLLGLLTSLGTTCICLDDKLWWNVLEPLQPSCDHERFLEPFKGLGAEIRDEATTSRNLVFITCSVLQFQSSLKVSLHTGPLSQQLAYVKLF